MSTQALFGDDDSSDEDDNPPSSENAAVDSAKKTTEEESKTVHDPTAAAAATTTEAPDKPAEEAAAAATTTTTAKPTTRGLFADSDEDDDDEDDVEFDDKGAVVGLPSTTMAGAKLPSQEPAATRGEEHDSDGRTSPMDDDMDEEKPALRTDPRPLTLPEAKQAEEGVTMHITKLPNLIGVKTTPFDPEDYHPILEEEDFGPSAVHNLVRWRYKKDATGHFVRDAQEKLQRESNTRLVEWEDGTWTLHVGTETFEVESKDSSTKEGFPGLNGYVHLSQPATVGGQADGAGEQPAGTVLECFGGIASRMSARPSSLQSEAHKSLTVAVRQRTIKKARIAEIATAEDPEKLKQERIRLKTDLEKASAAKQRRTGGGGGGGGKGRRKGLSQQYLEEQEDEAYDTFNIGKAKRSMRDQDEEEEFGNFDDDDDDDDDLEGDATFNTRRPSKRGRTESKQAADEEDEEMALEDDDDDDDDDDAAPVAKSKKPAHRNVLDDDEDSD